MKFGNTKKWFEDNGFIEKGQLPVDIKSEKIKNIKDSRPIFEIKSDAINGEKAIVYMEDFTFSKGKPLFNSNQDRSVLLEVGYQYAKGKGYKFFFFSCAYEKDDNFLWLEDTIISFEPYSIKVGISMRIGSTSNEISEKYYDKQKNILLFDMKRFMINANCEATIFNKNNNAKENIKNYLTIFNSRAFREQIQQIFIPTADETPDDKNIESDYMPHNLLVYGAPGTGKSYLLKEKIKQEQSKYGKYIKEKYANNIVLDSEENIENDDIRYCNFSRVTFYEDYTYESFVGCYKPKPESIKDVVIDGKNGETKYNILSKRITYGFKPGPFIEMLVKALQDNDNNYFLVIEELNRANAASVFGDMFQLLDRNEYGRSSYGIVPQPDLYDYLKGEIGLKMPDGMIYIPHNLYIWATMNSADQGVFPLDSAFKRRWNFYYQDISNPYIVTIRLPEGHYSWESIRTAINNKILSNNSIDEDRCIGSRFFSEQEINLINSCEYNNTADIKLENKGLFNKGLLNPFFDKLIAYLRLDLFRNNPHFMFNQIDEMKSLSMSEIRKKYERGKILEQLNIDHESLIIVEDNQIIKG